MSMLDSIFKQRFNAAKCKTLLKLTIPRIKLLRNRREIQMKQMRKDIAKLLETGQEATARIRVEHIIREEKMMAAQEIVELFCELIAVRLPIIEAQRECPLDLKEAISSICFAAPRCADLPELQQVQMLFAGKYGKEFVVAATELLPECGVNRQLVELLSIRAPAPDVKLKLLKDIAEEHQLDWDASDSERELLKPHEDLLNGPTQFVAGSQVPLPEEKHTDTHYTAPEPAAHEHTDSDEEFDIIDFPEVPKAPLPSHKGSAFAPEMLPFPASALSDVEDQEPPKSSGTNTNQSDMEPGGAMQEKSTIEEHTSREIPPGPVVEKQFVPFISPPPLQPSPSLPPREQNSSPTTSKTKSDNVDLQDVLAAAHAAAETAERAAAAARSAASIAQLRISELARNKNDEVSVPSVENPFHLNKVNSDAGGKTELSNQNSVSDTDSSPATPSPNGGGNYMNHQPTAHPSHYDLEVRVDPSSPGSNVLHPQMSHQPQRLPSMDDESYFSYPNLFTSQVSNLSSRAQSFKGSK